MPVLETIEAQQLIRAANSEGFGITRLSPEASAFEDMAIHIGQLIGARSFAAYELAGNASKEWMLKHTESITLPEERLPGYFALGCLSKAARGGFTTVYDGRHAASIIKQENPGFQNIITRYTSTVYANQKADHPLVLNIPGNEPVMRFRSRTTTNQIISGLPANTSEEEYYCYVENILDSSKLTAHNWEPGDFLLVNNLKRYTPEHLMKAIGRW